MARCRAELADCKIPNSKAAPGVPSTGLITKSLLQGVQAGSISEDYVVPNLLFVVGAGHHTTTSLITVGRWMLHCYPNALTRSVCACPLLCTSLLVQHAVLQFVQDPALQDEYRSAVNAANAGQDGPALNSTVLQQLASQLTPVLYLYRMVYIPNRLVALLAHEAKS